MATFPPSDLGPTQQWEKRERKEQHCKAKCGNKWGWMLNEIANNVARGTFWERYWYIANSQKTNLESFSLELAKHLAQRVQRSRSLEAQSWGGDNWLWSASWPLQNLSWCKCWDCQGMKVLWGIKNVNEISKKNWQQILLQRFYEVIRNSKHNSLQPHLKQAKEWTESIAWLILTGNFNSAKKREKEMIATCY